MRKWKKAGTIGLIAVMLCVSGAGCKKKATPERLFKDMAKNGETIESISGKMTANMEFAVEGQSVGMKMDFDLASVEKSEGFQMVVNLLMDIAGTEVSMDLSNYQLKEDDGLMSYTYVNNMWTKSPVESGEEETTLNAGMVEELTKQAKAFTLSEELVTVNGKECFELKGDIGGEFATDVLGEDMLDAFGMGGAVSEEELKELEIPCTITVYKKEILPASIFIDMKDVLMTAMEESGEMEIQELNLEMTFDEYNKVKEIKLPKEAKEEGFDVLAAQFAMVAEVEKHHEERYRALLNNVEMKAVFEKSGETMWECRNCGHLVMGKKAPQVCPVCSHPQSFFEVRCENY